MLEKSYISFPIKILSMSFLFLSTMGVQLLIDWFVQRWEGSRLEGKGEVVVILVT